MAQPLGCCRSDEKKGGGGGTVTAVVRKNVIGTLFILTVGTRLDMDLTRPHLPTR